MRIATLGLLAALVSASGAAAADLDYGYLRGADDDYAPLPISIGVASMLADMGDTLHRP
ncbi:hypothetical protein ACFQWF_18495 [Methylorubrum suomiense]